MNSFYYRLSFIATVLAMIVILLGAYTRLKDAGLGCPDWPGCYGQMIVPKTSSELSAAQALFPEQKVEPKKAWLEMIHRYFAGSLGLLIFGLTIGAMMRRKHYPRQLIGVPLLLSILVVFQAALGMWTVTLSLLPLVVVGHLLGGILIVALLWVLTLSGSKNFRRLVCKTSPRFRMIVILGAILVFFQIFLGGWVSANYAALVCPDFPACLGNWAPFAKIQEAFSFLSPVGMNYEGGLLDRGARMAIQMVHRYGAFLIFLYVGSLAFYMMASPVMYELRGAGWALFILLLIQILLGIFNVIFLLPIPIALAHNFFGIMLFLAMITLLCRLYFKSPFIYS